VLDDNKKLCLVSGEIIQLSPQMTMFFEVEDLAVASPATVSRCGMVYLESSALGLSPLLAAWVAHAPPTLVTHTEPIANLFNALVERALLYVRHSLTEVGASPANIKHRVQNPI
jgi:dynein heavy chain